MNPLSLTLSREGREDWRGEGHGTRGLNSLPRGERGLLISGLQIISGLQSILNDKFLYFPIKTSPLPAGEGQGEGEIQQKNAIKLMKDIIKGRAYVVGDAIDTDQIIPAEHLVYSLTAPEERRFYGRFALSGVPDEQQGLPQGNRPFTLPEEFESEYTIVIGGGNFGCGSSREHAPFALQEAGCEAVIAESYARIFYRNAVDGGFVVPFESARRLVERIRTGDELEIDATVGKLTNHTTGESHLLKPLGDVADILRAGNVFEYARRAGLMPA